MYDPQRRKKLIRQLQVDITHEIFKALKLSKRRAVCNLLKPLVWIPTRRFARFVETFDVNVTKNGFSHASAWAIGRLCGLPQVECKSIIPKSGPLLVISNHPGTYDALSILSNFGRDDVRLVVSGIPFFEKLPLSEDHLIFTTQNTTVRTNAIRQSLRHLEQNGVLLLFPTGRIDPDPAFFPSAAESISQWSRSIEVFMRKIPCLQVVPVIVSNVLSPWFFNHSFVKRMKGGMDRRRAAEFLQITTQMLFGIRRNASPKISIGNVINISDGDECDQDYLAMVKQEAIQLLSGHERKSSAG